MKGCDRADGAPAASFRVGTDAPDGSTSRVARYDIVRFVACCREAGAGTMSNPARPGERCFPRVFIVKPEGAEGTGMNPSPIAHRQSPIGIGNGIGNGIEPGAGNEIPPESAGVCPRPGVPSLMFFWSIAWKLHLASRKTSRGATSGNRLPVRFSKWRGRPPARSAWSQPFHSTPARPR